jgi:hypothetical protein
MVPSRQCPSGWAVATFWMAFALGACGGSGARLATTRRPRPPAAVARAQATHEYPSPAPPPQHAAGSAGPAQAVSAFARVYVNWDAQNVSERMLRLARSSIGQARSEMALAAAETQADGTLQQGGIANRGTVEAVAPRPGHRHQYVVVTRERTTSSMTSAYRDLAPSWHVTLATVSQVAAGGGRRWVVSSWQPES